MTLAVLLPFKAYVLCLTSVARNMRTFALEFSIAES